MWTSTVPLYPALGEDATEGAKPTIQRQHDSIIDVLFIEVATTSNFSLALVQYVHVGT